MPAYWGSMGQGVVQGMDAVQQRQMRDQEMQQRAFQLQQLKDSAARQQQARETFGQTMGAMIQPPAPQPPMPGQSSAPPQPPQGMQPPPGGPMVPPQGMTPPQGMPPPGPPQGMAPPAPQPMQKPPIPPYQTVPQGQPQAGGPPPGPMAPPPMPAAPPKNAGGFQALTPEAMLATLKAQGVPPDQWMGQLELAKPLFDMVGQERLQQMKIEGDARQAAQQTYQNYLNERRMDQGDVRLDQQDRHNRAMEDRATRALTDKEKKDAPKPVDQDLLESQAAQIAGGKPASSVIAGYSKDALGMRQQAQSLAIKKMMQQEPGLTAAGAGSRLNAAEQNFKSTGGALNQTTKDLAAIRPFKEMLDTNAEVAIQLGKKVMASDSRLANRSINWIKQNAGSNPDTAEYLAQIAFVQTEAARVLNNPRLVGQLSDSARAEMQHVLDGSMPIESTERVLRRIQKDGDNRVKAMEKERKSLTSDSGGKAPTTGPKPGTVEGGYRFKGGDPSDQANWEKQ